MIRHQIPRVYSKLLPEEILNFSIAETQATCGDCAMTREKRGARAKITYQGHLKCCTFQPMLVNYLVGELIAAGPSKQLQEQLGGQSNGQDESLDNHGEPIPLAVLPNANYRNRFAQRKKSDFGQRQDLLCGYYDKEKQNCSIWRSRGSVCTTFFCMSDLGSKGKRFWKLLGDYLHHVEMCLAEEALVHLDFSPKQVSEQVDLMLPVKRVEKLTAKQRKRIWNSYDKKEFYLRSLAWVQDLTRGQMPEILGEMGLRKEKLLLGQIRKINAERA